MLSCRSVGPYLLEAGLLEPSHLVDDGLTIRDLSRRNRVFSVVVRDGPAYLLKESADRDTQGVTPAHEAFVLERLWLAADPAIRENIPRLQRYDRCNCILVLEYLTGSPNLRDHYGRRGEFSVSTATALGRALAALHRLDAGWFESQDGQRVVAVASPPWVLSLHRPGLRTLTRISRANLDLLRTVQRSEPGCQALDRLARRWRASCLTHLDLKWDNCLAYARGPSGRKTAVKIIDWELARPGDPRWDVGAVFSEYLLSWVSSVPSGLGEVHGEDLLALARHPLEAMQPAIARFWHTYVSRSGLAEGEADRWLVGAVQYGAARLLQSTYEQMQEAPQLTAVAVCTVQLAVNILQHPEEAVVHLLGLPFRVLRLSA